MEKLMSTRYHSSQFRASQDRGEESAHRILRETTSEQTNRDVPPCAFKPPTRFRALVWVMLKPLWLIAAKSRVMADWVR